MRRNICLAILCIWVVAASLYSVFHLKIDNDITRLVSGSSSTLKLMDRLGFLDQLLIDVSPGKGAPGSAALSGSGKAIDRILRESGVFKSVFHRLEPEMFTRMMRLFHRYRFSLLDADAADFADFFSRKNIRNRLDELQRSLFSFDSFAYKKLLVLDPLGFFRTHFKKLMGSGVNRNTQLVNNSLMDREGKHLLFVCRPRSPSSDLDAARSIAALISRLRARFPKLRIRWYGGHRYALDAASLMQRDLMLISFFSFAGILCIYWAGFRNIGVFFRSLVPILSGIAGGFFVSALLRGSLHGITVVFGTILIGICIDYSTHFYTAYKFSGNARAAVGGIRRSLLFGYLTTVAIVAAFFFSPLSFFQEIALFFFSGITVSYLTARFVLPLFPGKVPGAGGMLDRVQDKINGILRRASESGRFLVPSVLLLLVAAGSLHLEFDSDIRNMNYRSATLRKLEKEILHRYGDVGDSKMLVVRGGTIREALRRNGDLYRELINLKRSGGISRFTSLHPVLPSRKSQRLSARKIAGLPWAKWERITLQEAVRRKFKPKMFRTFFKSMRSASRSTNLLTAGSFRGTPLQLMVEQFLRVRKNEVFAITLPDPEKGLGASTVRVLQEKTGAVYVDRVKIFNQVIRSLQGNVGIILLVSLLLILAILGWVYRSFLYSLVAVFPTVLGVGASLAIPALFGMEINIICLLAVVFIVGIGLDYGIFILESCRNTAPGKHVEHTIQAVAVAAMTTLLSFGLLVFSGNPVLRSLGLILLIGIIVTFLSAVLLIPGWVVFLSGRAKLLKDDGG